MKRSDFPRQCWALSGVLVGMGFLFASVAAAQAPSIEGTYQLISRQLPDGTVLKPPDIMGLWTNTKSHRNFNFVRKDATGKFRSSSVVSTYTLTATAYSETLLFSIFNDQIGGKDIVYDLSGKTQSVPVKTEGGVSSSSLLLIHLHLPSKATRSPRPLRVGLLTCGKRCHKTPCRGANRAWEASRTASLHMRGSH